jgi:hypothetical protein
MAEVLCVYREVAVLREGETVQPNVAIISYDEKAGIQAISSTAADLPPPLGSHAGWGRDHEYKRHGKLNPLVGIDLPTDKVHACVENCHRSREFIGFLMGCHVGDRYQNSPSACQLFRGAAVPSPAAQQRTFSGSPWCTQASRVHHSS